MSRPIGTLGTIPSLTIGQFDQRVITDLSNLTALYGAVSTASTNSSPRKANASAGYVVPGGKTFTIVAMTVKFASAFGGDAAINIGYNDVDTGILSATAGVNDVFLALGGTPIATFGLVSNACTVGQEKSVWIDNFVVPAGKYPLIYMNSGGSPVVLVVIYGYEV